MNFMTATVKVDASTKSLWPQLAKAKASVLSITRSMGKAFGYVTKMIKRASLAVGVLTAVVVAGIFKLTNAASAMEETQAKFNTVFKHLSAEANKWSENFASAVGRAKGEVKEWMARLQDTFVPLGMTRRKAYETAKSITKLAVDVASFNNKVDADVIRDFTSALVGNTETVRKYGVILSETEMKAEALREGIKTQYSEMSALEKVMLRYNLILAGSKDAMNDAIRTGDSYENQMKRLKSNWKDLQGMLGAILLPGMTKGVTNLNEWIISNKEAIAEFAESAFAKLNWLRQRVMHMWDNLSWSERFKGIGTALVETIKGALFAAGILASGLVDSIKRNIIGTHSGRVWEIAEAQYARRTGRKAERTSGRGLPDLLGARQYSADEGAGLSGKDVLGYVKSIAGEIETREMLEKRGIFTRVGDVMTEAFKRAGEKVDASAAKYGSEGYEAKVTQINKVLTAQLEQIKAKYTNGPQVLDPDQGREEKEKAVQATSADLKHLNDLQAAANKLKATLLTPIQNLRLFTKTLKELVNAQLLTYEEGRQLWTKQKAALMPVEIEQTPIKRASSMSFQRSLIDWRALSKDEESPVAEQKITNELLRRIERKDTLGI